MIAAHRVLALRQTSRPLRVQSLVCDSKLPTLSPIAARRRPHYHIEDIQDTGCCKGACGLVAIPSAQAVQSSQTALHMRAGTLQARLSFTQTCTVHLCGLAFIFLSALFSFFHHIVHLSTQLRVFSGYNLRRIPLKTPSPSRAASCSSKLQSILQAATAHHPHYLHPARRSDSCTFGPRLLALTSTLILFPIVSVGSSPEPLKTVTPRPRHPQHQTLEATSKF